MNRSAFVLLLIVLIFSCKRSPYMGNNYVPPKLDKSFAIMPKPPEVDYSLSSSWAALPNRKDMADSLPRKGMIDGQKTARVDVFFVHPTLFLSPPEENAFYWNADVNDQKMNEKVDGSSILNQASVFNESCAVYSPRYRQAHISSFFTGDRESGEAALEMAYQDVKKAFQYFIDNHSKGRPFIIAGHSQGTRHSGKLIKEVIEPNPELAKRMVAAYLVGMPVPPGYFSTTEVCDNPLENNCFVSWCTYQKGYYPPNYKSSGYENAICVNPLSWKTDSTLVSRKENLGGITWKFNKIEENINNAQVNKGILWIEKPHVPGRWLIKMDNYHVADYNLFWFNIRENVKNRCDNYFKNNNIN